MLNVYRACETSLMRRIAAVAVFPMRAGERVVGLMAFYFDEPRELQTAEADICGFIALQGASAVARALALPESLPGSLPEI